MNIDSLNKDQLLIAKKIIDAAEKNGVNPDFVLALAFRESSLNQKKISPDNAIGVMQLLPSTAKDLGVDPNNIDQNIEGGIKYIKQLSQNKKIGADPVHILASYNAGAKGASAALDSANIDDLLPETQDYVESVMKSLPDVNLKSVFVDPKESSESKKEPAPISRTSNSVFEDDDTEGQESTSVAASDERSADWKRGSAQLAGAGAGALVGGVKMAPWRMASALWNTLKKPVSAADTRMAADIAYGGQTAEGVSDATQAASGKLTGVDKYAPSQVRSQANVEQLSEVANMPLAETNKEIQQAVDKISAEAHPSKRIPVIRTVMRNGVPYQETIRYRPPAPSKGPELRNAVRPDEFIISDPYPSNVPPITQASLRGHNLGPTPYVAFRGQQSPFGIWEDSNPRDTGAVRSALGNAGRSTVNAARNVIPAVASAAPVIGRGALSVLGSAPVRGGVTAASIAGNLADYKTASKAGDTTGQAIAATGGLGALTSLVPKISPVGGLMAGGADAFRRAREGDTSGAIVSGGATLAPWALKALFGAGTGGAGSVIAMGAPMIYDAARYKAMQRAKEEMEAMKSSKDAAAFFQNLAPWER